MRTVEGFGRVPPRPVIVPLCSAEILTAWQCAAKRDAYRGYSSSKDTWRNGAVGDSRRPVYWGLLGEIAFSKWLYKATKILEPPDFKDKPWGDRGKDFTVRGYRIQVKTAGRDYSDTLIRTTEMDLMEPAFDVVVRCHYRRLRRSWSGLYGSEQSGTSRSVELCGWSRFFDYVKNSRIEQSRVKKAGWFNYVLGAEYLLPMSLMADRILADKLLEG